MKKQNNAKIKKWYMIKAIIINLIIAFVITLIILFIIFGIFGNKVSLAMDLINMVSIKADTTKITEIKFDEINNTLATYPEYGSRYANIKIDSLGIDLPLYYGDKLSILKNGIGQSSGAYFPGENGSIICMGHNTKSFLYNLPQIQKDAIIEINTSYGDFSYKVYDTKIVNMYNVDELPIQKDKEVFMLYTCYPVTGIGHKTDRFVVYADRIYN